MVCSLIVSLAKCRSSLLSIHMDHKHLLGANFSPTVPSPQGNLFYMPGSGSLAGQSNSQAIYYCPGIMLAYSPPHAPQNIPNMARGQRLAKVHTDNLTISIIPSAVGGITVEVCRGPETPTHCQVWAKAWVLTKILSWTELRPLSIPSSNLWPCSLALNPHFFYYTQSWANLSLPLQNPIVAAPLE